MHIPRKFKWRVRLNTILLITLIAVVVYLLTKPIDVLSKWKVSVTKTEYYPAETLKFTSEAIKLIDAQGHATRYLDCPADDNNQSDRIELPSLPVNRKAGATPLKTNQIDLPKASRFNTLPRTCRLHIDVCYLDVIVWRDKCESNETGLFTIRKPIDVQEQITPETQEIPLLDNDGITPQPPTTTTTNTTTNNTTNNITNNQPAAESEKRKSLLDNVLDRVGNLL